MYKHNRHRMTKSLSPSLRGVGGKKEEAMLGPILVKCGEKNPIWSLSPANNA